MFTYPGELTQKLKLQYKTLDFDCWAFYINAKLPPQVEKMFTLDTREFKTYEV